jgi:hypothetical protein
MSPSTSPPPSWLASERPPECSECLREVQREHAARSPTEGRTTTFFSPRNAQSLSAGGSPTAYTCCTATIGVSDTDEHKRPRCCTVAWVHLAAISTAVSPTSHRSYHRASPNDAAAFDVLGLLIVRSLYASFLNCIRNTFALERSVHTEDHSFLQDEHVFSLVRRSLICDAR